MLEKHRDVCPLMPALRYRAILKTMDNNHHQMTRRVRLELPCISDPEGGYNGVISDKGEHVCLKMF
jgi:hypothetical protein